MMEILAKVSSKSNFTLKWDNAPADYGSLFDVSEVISAFDFAVGTLPLSVVVRHLEKNLRQSQEADLPFTPESAIQMLEWGANPDASPYSHKQIAEWCDRFWCQYLDIDAPPEIEKLLPILTDVETQWDLYLANTYTYEQLRSQSFESERVPVEWFKKWLSEANA